MIPMAAIREEFGVATRLTPSTFYSSLEIGKGVIHYFFRSVRGVLPDLVATSSDVEDPEFAVSLLETVASQVDRQIAAPLKMDLSIPNAFAFDSALALPSAFHGHLKGVLDDKHKTLVLCLPIHRCEFTGRETVDEYRRWHTRVGAERWTRDPVPVVELEIENPRGQRSTSKERISFDTCMASLTAMKAMSTGSAKVTNYNGDTLLIQANPDEDSFVVAGKTRRKCSGEKMRKIVSAFVTDGVIPK
jgi:hypothetical protein